MSYGGFEYNAGQSFGGGGFDPMGGMGMGGDASGGGFMNADDKGAKASDKKSKDKQTILPLSIKQIITANRDDDTFKVDDQELHTVKIMGTVESWAEQATNYTFSLNDCSAVIECKQWIERDSGASLPSVREGMLVRVVGHLREFEGRVHVLVYDVRPVEDWNELTHHLLEVVMTHLQATKGPIPGSAAATAAARSGGALGAGFASPMGAGGMSGSAFGGPGMAGQRMSASGGNAASEFNDRVHNIYKNGDQNGLPYDAVLMRLRQTDNNVSLDQLRRAVAALCDEGRLYSTLDDATYAST